MAVHSAGVQGTRGARLRGARLLMVRRHRACAGLRKTFAAAGAKSRCRAWAAALFGWALEVARRPDRRFAVLPKRWIVERTFAWLDGYRINAKDYHHSPACAEAAVYASAVRLMLNRLHKP